MNLINKVLRYGCVLYALFPLRGGASQTQQPSTADLEAQPNTSQYPAVRMRRQIIRSLPPTADSNSEPEAAEPAQPNPPVPVIRPVPQINSGGPQVPTASTQGSPPAPGTPAPSAASQSQGQVFIGPPAPVPPTPEQMPPSAPKITYQNGLLSVESSNSRLIDILNGIRTRTGIQFEGIQSAPDRVAGKFGPAPVNEVLTDLLQGSRFDYVIIGMPENPEMVQRVILTPNGAGGAVAGTSSAPQPAATQPQTLSDEDENGNEEGQGQGEMPQEQVQVPQPQPQAGSATQPQIATPRTQEQLLEELKRMQQQQQQQQNQQNPSQVNSNPPNRPPAPIKPMIPQ